MKAIVEPERLQRLLVNVLVCHGKPALLDAHVGVFSAKGVVFKDITLEALAVNAVFSSEYFLEFEAKEGEQVPFSKSLLDIMKDSFKKEEKVEIRTKKDKIYLQGKWQDYEEPFVEAELCEIPFPFVAHMTMGLLPKDLDPVVQILVKADILIGLPKVDRLLFTCDGKQLSVFAEDVGKFRKVITPSRTKVLREMLGDTEMLFEKYLFDKIINQFGPKTEVWLTLRKDAMILSQRSKDYMLTYMLSSLGSF